MKTNGFTLLETIIYCALFSVLMSGALVTVYALVSSADDITKKMNIVSEATFINQKLSWAVANAASLEIIGTTTLKIIRTDLGSDSPLVFTMQNNQLYLARGTALPEIISTRPQLITDVTFKKEGSILQVRYTINGMPFAVSVKAL